MAAFGGRPPNGRPSCCSSVMLESTLTEEARRSVKVILSDGLANQSVACSGIWTYTFSRDLDGCRLTTMRKAWPDFVSRLRKL